MAYTKKSISISELVLDDDNQYRFALDEDHISDLNAAYTADDEVPPPVAWQFDGRYLVSQGFHRITAAKRAGWTVIECIVKEGNLRDFKIDCITGNAKHGLRLSSKEKRHAVGELLKLCTDWSNPRIAAMIGCDATIVVSVRAELEATSVLPNLPFREGVDGRVRKAKHSKEPGAEPSVAIPTPKVDQPIVSASSESVVDLDEDTAALEPEPKPVVVVDGEPPLDHRFMPNANESIRFAGEFLTWQRKLQKIREELAEVFRNRKHVVAIRIDVGAVANELSMMERLLGSQSPQFVCPACCGTTQVEGIACKPCDAYGIVGRDHYAALKPMWAKTRGNYDSLSARAELAEVDAT